MQCQWHACKKDALDPYPYCLDHMTWKERMAGREFVPGVTPVPVLEESKVKVARQRSSSAAKAKKEKRKAQHEAAYRERTIQRRKDYEECGDDVELAERWQVSRAAVRDWRATHSLPAKRAPHRSR